MGQRTYRPVVAAMLAVSLLAPTVGASVDLPISVSFSFKRVATKSGPTRFLCNYSAHRQVAHFIIEITPGAKPSDSPFDSGEGRFVAVNGSKNGSLLAALKIALGAKHLPKQVKRSSDLGFGFVILGEHQTRSAEGSFSSSPVGSWTACKVFLPKNGDDGEFYLDLDIAHGKGEFSLKDDSCGDYLLGQLAKVL